MSTRKELIDAIRAAQGDLRRSGSAALRALANLGDESRVAKGKDKEDEDGTIANPEPPKREPNTGKPVSAIDTVEPLSDDEAEKRTATFPAPVTNPDIQNQAEYTKMEALPSSEVNEANALDPVTGPLPANPEPAKEGADVIEGQTASEPEVDKVVKGAPKSKKHTSASVPTTEEVADVATTEPDPGTGETGFEPDEDKYGIGIYEGTPNVEAAKAGFPGATEEAKEKNEEILSEGDTK